MEWAVFSQIILTLPNENCAPLLPPAQPNTLFLTPVHAGVGSAPSPVFWAMQLNLRSQSLSGAQTVSNSNTETYNVCGNPTAQDVSQKVTKGQTSGVTVQCQQGKGTQYPDVWEPQFQHHYLETFVSWDVLEKGSVYFEACFRPLSGAGTSWGNTILCPSKEMQH